MKLSDFDYHLPTEKIAQTPAEPRDSAKLLTLCKQDGYIEDVVFSDIAHLLTHNDVLVLNETKVIHARLKGYIKSSQKACEIFLHKQINDTTWDCLVYPGKKLQPGVKIIFHHPDDTNNHIYAKILAYSDK